MSASKRRKLIRAVTYESGLGWIARCARTGKEIVPNFCWNSRSVARAVVAEHRALGCNQRYSACHESASGNGK